MKKIIFSLLLFLNNLYASHFTEIPISTPNISKPNSVTEVREKNIQERKDEKLKSIIGLARLNGMVEIPFNQKEVLKMIENPDYKFSGDKYKLGQMLFFDPRLSSSKIISCNTCHNLALNGIDTREAAIGDGWSINLHHLNTPTVYNAIFNKRQSWDGRALTLEEQAEGQILSSAEMNSTPEYVKFFINGNAQYLRIFRKIENNSTYTPTIKDVVNVIALYERTMISPSKYDAFLNNNGKMKGEYVYSEQETRGFEKFIEIGCVNCHTGINLGGKMKVFPVFGEYKHQLIGNFKGDKDGFTKVPTLRNVLLTAPYFHNGKIKTIEEAIITMAKLQLNLDLTMEEVSDIKSFLKTLNGIKMDIKYPFLPTN